MLEFNAQKFIRTFPYSCAGFTLTYSKSMEIVDGKLLEVNPKFETNFNFEGKSWIREGLNAFLSNFNLNSLYFFNQLEDFKCFKMEMVYCCTNQNWYTIDVFELDDDIFAIMLQNIENNELNLSNIINQKSTRNSKINLDFLFNSTQDSMFMAEYINNKFYYIYMNVAHERVTGFQNSDIIGKTPEEVWGEETGEKLSDFYSLAINKNKNQVYEEILDISGKSYNFLTSLSLASEDGHQYIIVSRKDITQYKELEESHLILLQRLQSMFNDHVANMLIIDPVTGKILDANPSACDFYGYGKNELLNMNIQDINMLPEKETAEQRNLAFERKKEHFIFPHRLSSGEVRLVDVYSCPIGKKGTPQLFSIIFDVTDRETYRTNLFHEKELLNTTLKSIGDGVVTTDIDGKIMFLNNVAEEIVGWRNEEAVGLDFAEIFILKNEETEEIVDNPVEKVLCTGKIIGLANHTVLVNRYGEKISVADSAAPIKDEFGKVLGVVMVFRDVRSEKIHQDEILYLSYHDVLTGLYNRRFVETELRKFNSNKQVPVSVIMGDVNGLKITNDVFGHDVGDELLKNVSEVFKESCTPNDIVARWGGDEFLLILPNTTVEAADKIVNTLRSNFLQRKVGSLQLSVSLGCAGRNGIDQNIEDVIRQAEEWMYHQKLLEGKSYRNAIINTLLATLYEKSMETEEHAKRLSKYCQAIGKKLKLSDKAMNELSLLSLLHDIGKVGIHQSILKKPGALTPQEWKEMKKHPEIGYRITQNTPDLSIVSEYILYHHERWDGSGYPKGLKGEEIPMCCRILAVADAFDAMTNDRVYRKALSTKEAVHELEINSGTQFSPNIIELFIKILQQEHGKKLIFDK